MAENKPETSGQAGKPNVMDVIADASSRLYAGEQVRWSGIARRKAPHRPEPAVVALSDLMDAVDDFLSDMNRLDAAQQLDRAMEQGMDFLGRVSS